MDMVSVFRPPLTVFRSGVKMTLENVREVPMLVLVPLHVGVSGIVVVVVVGARVVVVVALVVVVGVLVVVVVALLVVVVHCVDGGQLQQFQLHVHAAGSTLIQYIGFVPHAATARCLHDSCVTGHCHSVVVVVVVVVVVAFVVVVGGT